MGQTDRAFTGKFLCCWEIISRYYAVGLWANAIGLAQPLVASTLAPGQFSGIDVDYLAYSLQPLKP